MRARYSVAAALAFLLTAVAVQAGSGDTIIGTITGVNDDSISIVTYDERNVSVRLDEQTRYRKWITKKPWHERTDADARLLRVGRRVAISVDADDPQRAKLVRVAVE